MKIVFFGSSDFAVESLRVLIKHHDIKAVFTQPDRKKGRHLKLSETPVKHCAIENNLNVFQPADVGKKEVVLQLEKFDADLFVVISFGQKLSREILAIPKFYCINVHASLLPRYRGAAPINFAILNGDETSGISIIKMSEAMDAGDIILTRSIKIKDDDAPTLATRLSKLGAEVLLEAIERIEKNTVKFIKQDDSQATKAGKLKKINGLISWTQPAALIQNKVRGLLPWPCAYTYYKGVFLKILKTQLVDCKEERAGTAAAGQIITVCKKRGIIVACADGELMIEKLQPQGKREMSAYDFVLGHHVKAGDILGDGV